MDKIIKTLKQLKLISCAEKVELLMVFQENLNKSLQKSGFVKSYISICLSFKDLINQIGVFTSIDLFFLLTYIFNEILVDHSMDSCHLIITYNVLVLMNLVETHEHVNHISKLVSV